MSETSETMTGNAIMPEKEIVRIDPKTHTVDIASKVREEHRSASKKSRLKLLLQHRAIIEEVHSEEIDDKDLESPHKTVNSLFRLYDVVAEDFQKEEKASHEASWSLRRSRESHLCFSL